MRLAWIIHGKTHNMKQNAEQNEILQILHIMQFDICLPVLESLFNKKNDGNARIRVGIQGIGVRMRGMGMGMWGMRGMLGIRVGMRGIGVGMRESGWECGE